MGQPIRIAQVMGKMLGGGVEAVVMNYYRHIDRSKVQFDFLVDADSTLVPCEEIRDLGGCVVEVPPYQSLLCYERAIGRVLSDGGYRIVHSHINALSVFPLRAAKRVGIPVRIAHGHSTAGKGEHARNAVKTVLKRFSNVYPTHRFACSRYAGEWLFGKGADFEVVYNAIELDRFAFNAEDRAQARADLGLADDQFVIGHVGRFTPQKNHPFLIDAFARACECCDDLVLLCVGSGELRPFVERSVAERGIAGKVGFLGQRDDVNRLYQAFDVFVLPSLYEGLCLVGVEAQRAGLPCLLSDQITREIVMSDDVQFLPIGDSDIWAQELCRLSRSPFQVSREIPGSLFSSYDIATAAGGLGARYEELNEEAKCQSHALSNEREAGSSVRTMA